MARFVYGPILAFRSTADYSSAGQYTFVKYSGSVSTVDGLPTVTQQSTLGTSDSVGVLLDKPKANETASVQTYDVCKVVAGAALATVGTKISSDASGRAIAAISTYYVLGETMEVAGAIGDIISVRLYNSHTILV
jgi:Uncharacterized conserved protein (DUF2190)